jgi:hypothetical protein
MAFNSNIPFSPTTGSNLRQVERGVVLTEVPGLGNVETYGQPLTWRKVTVLKDNSIITDKRDRFDKRNTLVNTVAELGEFEYALAVSPTVNGKRAAQCSLCNAHHNWCVFYRTLKGAYLGWSGTDCFGEIVRNLGLPAAEAMIEAVKAERTRSEKFRRTMEKVNDFKRDFPGLYEHRDLLASGSNPYRRLWQETVRRLDSANGVDEKWLADCESGVFDRSYRVREGYYRHVVKNDQQARRIPKFLKWCSDHRTAGVPINEVINLLQQRFAAEEEARKKAEAAALAAATPQPAPAAPKPVVVHSLASRVPPPQDTTTVGKASDEVLALAKRLQATGNYGWSKVIEDIIAGKNVSGGAVKWILQQAAALPVPKV